MTCFIKNVSAVIRQYQMLTNNDAVLIGLSGGLDSMTLLNFFLGIADQWKLRIATAHVNHALRGADSDNDACFVEQTAKSLSLEFFSCQVDVKNHAKTNKLCIEEAARELRYQFLESVAYKHGFTKIALAHHSDDNAELVLMNILRGSGITGLTGIPPVRNLKNLQIIRPFIGVSRSQIKQYAESEKIKYTDDLSNYDHKYLRNKIRHELLPLLQKDYNQGIYRHLNQLSCIARDEESWSESVVESDMQLVIINKSEEKIIANKNEMLKIAKASRMRLFKKFIAMIKGNVRKITSTHLESLDNLVKTGYEASSLNLPDNIEVNRDGNSLSFFKKISYNPRSEKIELEHIIKEPGNTIIHEIGLSLNLSVILDKSHFPLFDGSSQNYGDSQNYDASQNVVFFDMQKITFPMILRFAKPGDRFVPFGMDGEQKLKKFFINNKISSSKRWNIPILLSRNKIVWIIGYRIDNRVRINSETSSILKAEIVELIQ